MDKTESQFNGWARVEVMGHQTHIGYVRTEAYGGAVLFRVDIPGLEEREFTLTEPEYATFDGRERWVPAGSVVKREALPGCSVLVGSASIYRIIPCDEAAARRALDELQRPRLMVVSLPRLTRLGEASV